MTVTIRDVARLVGVHPGTVSKAIHRPELINTQTRARILQAMEQLGYVPNAAARAVRSGQTRSIGLVVLDIGNPFFTELAKAVEQCASESNRVVDLFNSAADRDREARLLQRMFEMNLDGLIIMPLNPENPLLHQLSDAGTPVVVLAYPLPGQRLSTVRGDEYFAGQEVGRHLLAMGHRSILLAGPVELPRFTGAADAALAGGASVKRFVTQGAGVQDGRELGSFLIGLPPKQRQSAVVCNNDLIALGLMQIARREGLRVPEDLAVVGYDDTALASTASAVGLTSVYTPPDEVGRAAARIVLEELSSERVVHQEVIVRPVLQIRASTDPTAARPPSGQK